MIFRQDSRFLFILLFFYVTRFCLSEPFFPPWCFLKFICIFLSLVNVCFSFSGRGYFTKARCWRVVFQQSRRNNLTSCFIIQLCYGPQQLIWDKANLELVCRTEREHFISFFFFSQALRIAPSGACTGRISPVLCNTWQRPPIFFP